MDVITQQLSSGFLERIARELAETGAREAGNLLETIVELEAENTTPIIPGGHDTYTVNERGEWEDIRPTALRGVWRWWIRALLAGILWEEGVRDYDYRKLALIESRLLGLGAVDSRIGDRKIEGEATRLILSIEKVDTDVLAKPLPSNKFSIPNNDRFTKRTKKGKIEPNTTAILNDYIRRTRTTSYESEPWKILLSIPRYALLCTGKSIEETKTELYRRQPIPPGKLKLTVALRENKRFGKPLMKTSKILGSAALILALAWGGVGQATTRGFGKMGRISIVEDKLGVAKEIWSAISCFNGGDPRKLIENITKIVIERIPGNELKEMLKQLGAGERTTKKESIKLPSTPTFHPETTMISIIRNPVIRVRGYAYNTTDVWSTIVAIGRACLKLEWKALARMNFRASGRRLHTWPLGLPRYMEVKIKRKSRTGEGVTEEEKRTGYAFKEDDKYVPGRLTSLVRFVPLLSNEKTRVLIYAFKTADLDQASRKLLHLRDNDEKKIAEVGIYDPTSLARAWRGKAPRKPQSPVEYLEVAFRTVERILSR